MKNAFVNGELEEEVYMSLPLGFEEDKKGKMVCKLQKSLYDLNQPSRAWFERFSKVIKSHKYSQGQTDHTLFVKHSSNKRVTIQIVYVDDIILTGNDFNDRKSTFGYCTRLWGNLMTWCSKKQFVVARSSAEAEYRVMAHGICEAIWIKRLPEE